MQAGSGGAGWARGGAEGGAAGVEGGAEEGGSGQRPAQAPRCPEGVRRGAKPPENGEQGGGACPQSVGP